MSTLDASSEVRSENLTSRNPSLGTVHSRKLLSRIREERFRLPAHNATARFEISLREEERRSENKARCTSRFVSSPFRFSPSAFSRLRASARLCTLRFYLSAAFVPSRCSSLRVGTALARVSGFPKRFPETEMLALAMQALSLVPQRPGDPWLPVITLSLSLSLVSPHLSPSAALRHTRFSRSVSPPIPLAVLCILLPHDKCRANIRDSHS